MFEDILNRQYWHNSLLTWLFAAAAVVGITLTLYTMRRITIGRLKDTAPLTPSLVDDVVLEIARRTSFIFQVAMGVAVATYLLTLPDRWDARLRTAVVIIGFLQAAMWGTAIVSYLVVATVDKRSDPRDLANQTGKNMLRFLGRLLVWVAASILCLDNLGINVTTLIAGLGVTGVAVALATQNIVGDLFASISILLDKPFVVGDYIVLDGGYMGKVERIGIKTTRVRSLSGEEIVFANSDLTKGRLRNYKTLRERRVLFNFGVAYGTPAAKLAQVGPMIRDIIAPIQQARFDRAHFSAFADSSLRFEVVYFVLDPEFNNYMDVQEMINLALCDGLATMNVALAAPTTLVVAMPPPVATL